MSEMSEKYKIYLDDIIRFQEDNPEWRFGQTCFNVLFRYHPTIAEEVRGSPIDPFYDTKVSEMTDFFSFVFMRLNE